MLARVSVFPSCTCRVQRQPIHQAQSLVPEELKLLLQPLAVTLQLGHCACQLLRPVQRLGHSRLQATLPLLHIVLARMRWRPTPLGPASPPGVRGRSAHRSSMAAQEALGGEPAKQERKSARTYIYM